jgi:hypothetical protein
MREVAAYYHALLLQLLQHPRSILVGDACGMGVDREGRGVVPQLRQGHTVSRRLLHRCPWPSLACPCYGVG